MGSIKITISGTTLDEIITKAEMIKRELRGVMPSSPEIEEVVPPEESSASTTSVVPLKKRGRPRKSQNMPEPPMESAAPAPAPAPAAENRDAESKLVSRDEMIAAIRAYVAKHGMGPAQEIVKRYTPSGRLVDIDPEYYRAIFAATTATATE